MKRKSEKPELILDATFRLLKNKRYYEITTDDIANEAQVGKGTLYRYFADKEELLIKLAEANVIKLTELSKKSIQQDMTLKEKLLKIAETCQSFLTKNPAILKIMNEEYEIFMSKLEEDLKCDHHRPFLSLLSNIFEESISNGELTTNHSPFFLVVTFKSIIRGVCELNFFVKECQVDLNESIEFFLKGITDNKEVKK